VDYPANIVFCDGGSAGPRIAFLMFFYASKIIWYVAQPSSMLLLLFALGLLLYWRGWRKTGRHAVVLAVAIYAIGGLSPLANALMLSLEQQVERRSVADAGRFDGLIVLGGVIDGRASAQTGQIALNEAAERLTEAAALAHANPEARIVISGGDGALLYEGRDEAVFAERFFTRLGFDERRISIERQSRNTWENAVLTKALLQPEAGQRWLLITSAFHMNRAMGVFRAADFDVTPWPVDFRTLGYGDLWRVPPSPSAAWKRIDLTVKEWVGYVAYWMTGRLELP